MAGSYQEERRRADIIMEKLRSHYGGPRNSARATKSLAQATMLGFNAMAPTTP